MIVWQSELSLKHWERPGGIHHPGRQGLERYFHETLGLDKSGES